MNKFDYQKIFE